MRAAARARFLLTLALMMASLPATMWTTAAQSGRATKNEPPKSRPVARPRPVAAVPVQSATEATPTPTPSPAPVNAQSPRAVVSDDSTDAPPPRVLPSPTPAPAAQPRSVVADEIDDNDVVRISANLVPLPASVIDAQGRAVQNLELQDFELKVDGEVRPIGDLSRAETPVVMAVLFDNSSSLRSSREFEKKAAVEFLRRVVRPIDRAAIYSVSTEPQLSVRLTNDVRALVRTIENFPEPKGATALFDAIAEAALYLKPHKARKVIVIVSDGTDTISNLGFDETLAKVLAADCQVYAVQTGHSDHPNLRDLAGERRLEEFAANTGGTVYAPRSTADFNTAFSQIAADLAQQYVLGYYPPDSQRGGRFHTVSLRVPARPNLRVRTRKGFYSPKG